MKRRIADKIGQPLLLAMLAWVHRSRGAYQDAIDTAEDALAMALEIDHPWWTAWAGANLGATLLELRCPEQAAESLARAQAAADKIGVRSQLLRGCAHLAWASWLTGDSSQADTLLHRDEALLAGIRAPNDKTWLFGADAYLAVAYEEHLSGQRRMFRRSRVSYRAMLCSDSAALQFTMAANKRARVDKGSCERHPPLSHRSTAP